MFLQQSLSKKKKQPFHKEGKRKKEKKEKKLGRRVEIE
jgi:hypothetical protein